MKVECFKKLSDLNEEELKNCNGGIVASTELKTKLPPICLPYPLPDDEHRL